MESEKSTTPNTTLRQNSEATAKNTQKIQAGAGNRDVPPPSQPPDTANSNSTASNISGNEKHNITSTNPIGVSANAIQAIQNMDSDTTIPINSYDKKPVDKRDRLEKNREVRHSIMTSLVRRLIVLVKK